MVPKIGVEPIRCRHRGILSPLRLPIPPFRLVCLSSLFCRALVCACVRRRWDNPPLRLPIPPFRHGLYYSTNKCICKLIQELVFACFTVVIDETSIAFKDLQLPDSLEYWSSLIYCVLCKSSNQYDVSFASFNAICNFETKSDLPWAYLASLMFAPMLVPLLPIWLEIILSCCAFNCLTKPMICTAKSNDCSASLSVAMLNLPFANILTQFDDLSMKHCVAT